MAEMGLGDIGLPQTVFKRKFRWTLEVQTNCVNIGSRFVKTAARPNLDIEETEVNFLNAKTWIPGKATWQPLEVTYYDANHQDVGALLVWLSSVYDFMKKDAKQLNMNSRVDGYSGKAILTLYDGCGSPMEEWTLQNVWPKSMDFGDLDMASSDICEIKVSLRFTNVLYNGICPPVNTDCGCESCS